MAVVDKHILMLLGLNPDRPSNTLGRRAGSRIRLLHGSTNSSVAPPRTHERRQAERLTPDQTKWADVARLRPGLDVHVIDIGTQGVLLEASVRLHVGQRMEMTLMTDDGQTRLDIKGCVRRCHVSNLTPLVYRGALEFDDSIELMDLEPFLTLTAISA